MICQYKGANISEIRWDNASSNAPAGVAEIFINFFSSIVKIFRKISHYPANDF